MSEKTREELNAAYQQAHRDAEQELKSGRIRSYSCTHTRERGRLIFFETDQGWNPEPYYEDFPREHEAEVPN